MTGFGEFLGKTGEAAWQLFVWQIAGQIVAADLTPYLTELTYLVNEHHPDIVLPLTELAQGVIKGLIPKDQAAADAAKLGIDGARFEQLLRVAKPRLAPADLAQLVVRNFMARDTAATEAALSGLDGNRFDDLVRIAGDAPGPSDLAVAFRRKIIAEDGTADGPISFRQGIREGRLADKYAPMIEKLATLWPSPVDALQAELEGQLSHEEALATYERLGGDPQFYPWLFNTRGTAPSPVELGVLLNRGLIPLDGFGPDSISFRQGILEGPSRNKWSDSWLALKDYVIPPRSVVAMLHAGIITDDQAARFLAMAGANHETIAAFIAEGHARAAATDKQLTQAAVIDLFNARIIAEADAHGLLVALGYSDQYATYLITLANLRRVIAETSVAVSRVRSQYITRKIRREVALEILKDLAVPADQITAIVHIWDLEQGVTVKQLSEAQIVNAWSRQIITTEECVSELTTIGYTPFDAWVLMSIKAKGPIDGKPAQGPNPVGTVP
jgi:hypothetical protein